MLVETVALLCHLVGDLRQGLRGRRRCFGLRSDPLRQGRPCRSNAAGRFTQDVVGYLVESSDGPPHRPYHPSVYEAEQPEQCEERTAHDQQGLPEVQSHRVADLVACPDDRGPGSRVVPF